MELTLLSQIASLGLGAVIAVIVLIWKRGDDATHRKEIIAIIERMEVRDDQIIKLVETTTAAMVTLQIHVIKLAEALDLSKRLETLEKKRGK
uniref:Holin n=1 Tax=viral metagenome TaxID=1070528 RepID=A0A6H1ZBE6_9ZZZZ